MNFFNRQDKPILGLWITPTLVSACLSQDNQPQAFWHVPIAPHLDGALQTLAKQLPKRHLQTVVGLPLNYFVLKKIQLSETLTLYEKKRFVQHHVSLLSMQHMQALAFTDYLYKNQLTILASPKQRLFYLKKLLHAHQMNLLALECPLFSLSRVFSEDHLNLLFEDDKNWHHLTFIKRHFISCITTSHLADKLWKLPKYNNHHSKAENSLNKIPVFNIKEKTIQGTSDFAAAFTLSRWNIYKEEN